MTLDRHHLRGKSLLRSEAENRQAIVRGHRGPGDRQQVADGIVVVSRDVTAWIHNFDKAPDVVVQVLNRRRTLRVRRATSRRDQHPQEDRCLNQFHDFDTEPDGRCSDRPIRSLFDISEHQKPTLRSRLPSTARDTESNGKLL